VSELLVPGRVLGDRYRLTAELARGGMATVWVAEDPLLSRRVAVKILHRELAVDESLRTRFRHEAVAAARLSHPGIVATYDTGDDEGVAYIVMQLVEGPTLRRVLDERGPLPVGEAVEIVGQVAEALDHAHQHGLVHRDVKPANVLVPPDGHVKVTDFGIAKATGADDLTRSGAVIGTARYLAPEQVNGGAVDGRADVYALGLILYETLTGTLPFAGDTEIATAMARLTTVPDPVRAVRPEVPPMLESVVSRSLARDPDDRFQSAGALRDALDPGRSPGTGPTVPSAPPEPTTSMPPVDGTLPVDSPPAAPAPPPRPARARRPARWPLALLAMIALVAVGAALYVATRTLVDDGGGDGGGESDGTAPATPIAIVGASDFDPDGDDQEENSGSTGLAVDEDPATVWSTQTYNNRDFDEPKRGVGIVVETDGAAPIRRVEVATDDDDWNGAVYVAEDRGVRLEDWGAPVDEQAALGRQAGFDVPEDASGRYVLLWITRLPADGKLGIAEVSVAG
jgi:tRNA A-37 threonylcarbamoyl transferase component Bud32